MSLKANDTYNEQQEELKQENSVQTEKKRLQKERSIMGHKIKYLHKLEQPVKFERSAWTEHFVEFICCKGYKEWNEVKTYYNNLIHKN